MDVNVVTNFLALTLEWAASMGGGYPSQRLEFLKEFINMLTSDELHRLKKMLQNAKRRVVKQEMGLYHGRQEQKQLEPPEAATSSSDAANSSVGNVPQETAWWNNYEDEEIVAWDAEFVSYPANKKAGEKKCKVVAATVDVVGTDLSPVISRKIFHAKNSFLVNKHTRLVNGFSYDTFSDPKLPKIETVRKELDELFQKKALIITLGGIHDYNSINLKMGDYDTFDLQSHWYWEEKDELGNVIRHPHSLRSLCSHYLKEDFQSGTHSSYDDAVATMKLFKVYKRIKLEDDPKNLQSRCNEHLPYDKIPVLKSTVKQADVNK